jgi:hypothetical protein
MRMTDSLVLFEEAGRSLLVDPIIPGIAAATALAQCATAEAENMLRSVLAGETIYLLASKTDSPVVNAARRANRLVGSVAALILDGIGRNDAGPVELRAPPARARHDSRGTSRSTAPRPPTARLLQ